MSREIKFRAFRKDFNTMHIVENINFDLPITLMCADLQTDAIYNFILMQYTGLKDKNGVEIYEGDIISHHNETISMFEKVEVKYWEGAFVAGRCTANDALVNYNVPSYVEVIGNIYQNPELL